ncbi:uncharacterized protein T551_01665 [Pneumocystis jirovecii RU7]|uniref:Uncharacterized protein n=1 Tax=Pneumocystis jirovecii (strain RU7) TaxID=1408657 RepID=A0A0W4ZPU4_PNEJ7|nr:uncharacterized protein T551_01665 [Pneumocystis jirovecii RU7]KTW30382.1 hypothetical protein T551_01665 [Pneumocystis jirovecii RU7]
MKKYIGKLKHITIRYEKSSNIIIVFGGVKIILSETHCLEYLLVYYFMDKHIDYCLNCDICKALLKKCSGFMYYNYHALYKYLCPKKTCKNLVNAVNKEFIKKKVLLRKEAGNPDYNTYIKIKEICTGLTSYSSFTLELSAFCKVPCDINNLVNFEIDILKESNTILLLNVICFNYIGVYCLKNNLSYASIDKRIFIGTCPSYLNKLYSAIKEIYTNASAHDKRINILIKILGKGTFNDNKCKKKKITETCKNSTIEQKIFNTKCNKLLPPISVPLATTESATSSPSLPTVNSSIVNLSTMNSTIHISITRTSIAYSLFTNSLISTYLRPRSTVSPDNHRKTYRIKT